MCCGGSRWFCCPQLWWTVLIGNIIRLRRSLRDVEKIPDEDIEKDEDFVTTQGGVIEKGRSKDNDGDNRKVAQSPSEPQKKDATEKPSLREFN